MPSSVIHGMLYSPAQQTLDVVFRGAGGTYRYHDVRPEEWRAFKRAPSKGTYLNATFKAQHPRVERYESVPKQWVGALAASAIRDSQDLQDLRDLPDENVWGFYERTS